MHFKLRNLPMPSAIIPATTQRQRAQGSLNKRTERTLMLRPGVGLSATG